MHNLQMLSPHLLTDNQLLQDFSTALIYLKKKLNQVLTEKHEPSVIKILIKDGHSQGLRGMIDKYRGGERLDHRFRKQIFQLCSLIQRFAIRVKEMLHHFSNSTPKHRNVALMLARQIQIVALQSLQKGRLRQSICILLDFIDQIPLKLAQIKTGRMNMTSYPLQSRTDKALGTQSNDTRSGTASRKQNEAQRFIRTVKQYSCMQVDSQFLRGRYFNMKSNRQAEQKQMMGRNNYIRQIMTRYQNDYDLRRCKSAINVNRTKDKNIQKTKIPESIKKSAHNKSKWTFKQTQMADSDFNITIKGSQRQLLQTVDAKPKSASFRMAYQQKLRQRKSQKAPLRNATICEEVVSVAEKVNERRRQFVKKSKEQIRFRYKYYTYQRSGTNFNTARRKQTQNPEYLITTLNFH